MIIKELKELIKDLPDDTLIYERRYSDFGPIQTNDIISIEDVIIEVSGDNGWGRLVKNKKLLSQESLNKIKKVLVFWGN